MSMSRFGRRFTRRKLARDSLMLCAWLAAFPRWSRGEKTATNAEGASSDVVVRVDRNAMTRGGHPYFVIGAGGGGSLRELAARGANSVRTWSTRDLGATLKEAAGLGLTVSVGIWLEQESDWFSYANPEHCDRQAERVRAEIAAHRGHPALLAWGIGNEVDGDGSREAYWRQLRRLVGIAKDLDPTRPVFTAVAGVNQARVDGLNRHVPDLDFLGVNIYGGIFGLRDRLEKFGWTRPWMVTEWGPRGFWESPRGPGDAPREQTSTAKAEMMSRAYREVIRPEGGCLGSYAFVWGWKFEATATWFGIFTGEGETTAVADVLQEAWGGGPPANRAPEIRPLQGVPKSPVASGTVFEARATASDPEGDPLSWHWLMLPEAKPGIPHTPQPMPKPIDGAVAAGAAGRAAVTAPAKPGIYRLHVRVVDGNGHAATANEPFVVE